MDGILVCILIIIGAIGIIWLITRGLTSLENRLEARTGESCFIIPYGIALLTTIICYIVYFNTDDAIESISFILITLISLVVSIVYFVKHIKRHGLKDALLLAFTNIFYTFAVVVTLASLVSLIGKLFGDNDKKGK